MCLIFIDIFRSPRYVFEYSARVGTTFFLGSFNCPRTPYISQGKAESVFVYDKSKNMLVHNGQQMSLKGKMLKILKALDEPRKIKWILKKLYKEDCKNDEKIRDSKRNSFDKAVYDINRKFEGSFKVNDGAMTSNRDGTYSRRIDIKWE